MIKIKYKALITLVPIILASCSANNNTPEQPNQSSASQSNNKCNYLAYNIDKSQNVLLWSSDDKKIFFEEASKYLFHSSIYHPKETGNSILSIDLDTLEKSVILPRKEQVIYNNFKWLNNNILNYKEDKRLLGLAQETQSSSVLYYIKEDKKYYYSSSLIERLDDKNFYFVEKDSESNPMKISLMELDPVPASSKILFSENSFFLSSFNISPDKTRAVLTYDKYSSRIKHELYSLDFSNSKYTKLSKEDMTYKNIEWSSDNNTIYFERTTDECQNIDNIFSLNLKTGEEKQITKLNDQNYSYDLVSVLDDKLLLRKISISKDKILEDSIEIVKMDGSIDKRLLSISGNYSISLSNSKNKLAILKITTKDDGSIQEELSTMNIDGTDTKTLLKIE